MKSALGNIEIDWKNLFEKMSLGFAVHRVVRNKQGKVTDYVFLKVNEMYEKLTGLNEKQVLNKRVRDVIKGVEEEWIEKYGRVVDTNKSIVFDLHSSPLKKDYRVYAFKVGDEEFASVFEDITDWKISEDRLNKSRDFYLQLLELFPALVWRSGTDAKCNYFNKAWLEFTGRPLEKELGDGWAEGVFKDDLARCVKIYQDSFKVRKPFEMKYRLRRHDGKYRWINDIGKPFIDENGKFGGYIGSCFDVNDETEKAGDILERTTDLETMNRLMVDREIKMIELKKEIESLKNQITKTK